MTGDENSHIKLLAQLYMAILSWEYLQFLRFRTGISISPPLCCVVTTDRIRILISLEVLAQLITLFRRELIYIPMPCMHFKLIKSFTIYADHIALRDESMWIYLIDNIEITLLSRRLAMIKSIFTSCPV